MKVEIKKFEEEYVKDFVYDGVESHLRSQEAIRELIKFHALCGDIYMAVVDGKMIACAGIIPMPNLEGQGVFFLNQEAKTHIKTILKEIKEKMEAIQYIRGYQNITTFCLEDSDKANNLLKHLGFTAQETWVRYVKE